MAPNRSMTAAHDVILILRVGMRIIAGQLNAIAWDRLQRLDSSLLQCAPEHIAAIVRPTAESTMSRARPSPKAHWFPRNVQRGL
jgi:hypothetical protein